MMFTRVYLRDGDKTHLLPAESSPNGPHPSLCGRQPWPDYWFGTGSQGEHDKAKELPLCMACKGLTKLDDVPHL